MKSIMLTLKRFLFGIFLLDPIIIREVFCDQFMYDNLGEKTFWNAKVICQSYNLTLPVLENLQEYQDFWNFLSTSEYGDTGLWLGLQWNNLYGGFYQWLNGNILGIRKWAMSEPTPQPGQRCVYADGDKKWRTSLCTSAKNVLCFYKGHKYEIPNHPRAPVAVGNYSTAYEVCQKTGGRLPVLVTPADSKLLSLVSYSNFWLGLVENGGQFVWITGKKLGLYHLNNGLSVHVYGRVSWLTPYVSIKTSFKGENKHFCCQNRTSDYGNVGSWGHNYFKLVERNAIPLESPRSQVFVGKGIHCAVVCSRDVGCHKYTIDGSICRTFGKTDYVVTQGGVLLFQNVRIW